MTVVLVVTNRRDTFVNERQSNPFVYVRSRKKGGSFIVEISFHGDSTKEKSAYTRAYRLPNRFIFEAVDKTAAAQFARFYKLRETAMASGTCITVFMLSPRGLSWMLTARAPPFTRNLNALRYRRCY